MADSTKNKEFLQQLERQRLNKPCNRIIDLRGKVSGECQSYMFGNLTHYLDDRAYLLAKQLLDRFDGRYTIGVYEVLLKVLKSLESENTKKEAKPILLRDKDNVQIIDFDSFLHRKEPRILHATPIEIHIADVLYHATTINITTSAIRIASKRTFTLEKGSTVTVNFLDLATTLLSKVHYKILSIEHDEQRTYAILVRNRADNESISSWLDQWTQDHNSPEHIDIDNELFNLTSNYYLRLFTNTMHSPLFWFTNDSNITSSVIAFHNAPLANLALASLQLNNYEIDFSLLPFNKVIKQQCDYLVLIYKKNSSPNSIAIPCSKPQLISSALSWHSQQENSHVLLLRTQSIAINIDDFNQELKQLSDSDADYAQVLTDQLTATSNLVSLTDITNSCQLLPSSKSVALLPTENSEPWLGLIPKPTPLHHYISRKSSRFFIKTNVVLDLYHASHSVITTDVSETGMSLNLPGFEDLKAGSHITVNFERWQSQTNKVKLHSVPYIIRNVQFWEGSTQIGLERNFPACAESINKFFSSKIAHHKEQLAENTHDIPIVQEAKIFTQVLGKKLNSIPFYLGTDENNTRILQAVASSQNNHTKELSSLWQSMQALVTPLSGKLKSAMHKNDTSIYFGLYCYIEPSGEWQIMTDYEFSTATRKAVFINRALTHEKYYFFHCSITPLKLKSLEQQGDLKQQLSELRSHSPHKIKQIRDTLHSLFAIGELSDITDIISASYQN